MQTKHHFVLARSALPVTAMPDVREASITRDRRLAGAAPPVGKRPGRPRRRLLDGYRLTWAIAIATALGSGFTIHQILYEDEDGPSPAATFAAVVPARANASTHVPGHASETGSRQSAEEQQTKFLVRSTLMALDDANRSGNYTVLRDLAGPRFQARNSALRLRQVFEAFREAGVDLSHASLVEPRIDKRSIGTPGGTLGGTLGGGAAGVTGDGVLAVEGHVPSPMPDARQQVRYAMEFEPVQGHWRLLTLSVGIEPTGRDGRAR